MKLSLRSLSLVACAAMVTCVTLAKADTVAYVATGTENDLAGYGLSGILFTPTLNIDVTQLGFTAISLNTGGDTPHVTLSLANGGGSFTQLYDTGNIVSTVIADNTNNNINSGAVTTYVSVGTPIELFAGQTYLVSAPAYWVSTYNTTTDGLILTDPAIGSANMVSDGGWNGWANSGYDFSTLTLSNSAAVPTTANFQFNVDPDQSPPAGPSVPEPSTYALLGAGLALLALKLRRRTASSQV